MSPRTIAFTKEAVVAAGLRCVRTAGLAGLTARAVARELGTSVGPIYRACGSMDALEQAVLEQAVAILRDYTRRAYTPMPFRNVGVGMGVFAREEPQLYQTLFVERHHSPIVIETFAREIAGVLAADSTLGTLPPERRDILLQDLWVYAHGLAMSIVAGLTEATDDDAINARIGRVGFTLITAAFGGDTRWAFPPDSAGQSNQPPATETSQKGEPSL